MKSIFSRKRIWMMLAVLFFAVTSVTVVATLAKYVSTIDVGSFGFNINIYEDAYAVYFESDNSLEFFKDGTPPQVGDIKNGKTVTKVYPYIETEDYSRGWGDIAGSVETITFHNEITPKTTASWFSGFAKITTLSLSNLNTENVQSMAYMFNKCQSLTKLDVSNFNTKNVTSMAYMFTLCDSLTELNVSGFYVENVTNMKYMFNSCESLTSLDLSNFNTLSLTNTERMFAYNDKLQNIKFGKLFNTSNVTTMLAMFDGCIALKNLDLSGFDTARVTNMYYMFQGCHDLETIYVSSNFITTKVASSVGMFKDCNVLKGGRDTMYNESNPKDKTYARIDGGPDSDTPGYFTEHTVTIWTQDTETDTHTGTCSCTEHTSVTVTEKHTYVGGACSKCKKAESTAG